MNNKQKILISNSDVVESEVIEGEDPQYYFNDKLFENVDGDVKSIDEVVTEKVSEIINKFMGRQYENTLVLTGAGSSILRKDDIDVDMSDEIDFSNYTGKTMGELKQEIEKRLDVPGVFLLNEIADIVKYSREEGNEFNIEDLLSKVEQARAFVEFKDVEKFDSTITEIQRTIKNLCKVQLSKFHKHGEFMNKLVAQKKSHNRIKIFTTNYDTLFEQSLKEEGYILLDSFSYEFPRTFNSRYFDYDFIIRGENKIIDEPDFVDKVAHLYKIHGSIDWYQNDKGEVIKSNVVDQDDNSLMIYPRRAKYEQSYEIPYFDLFSRFQIELRKPSTLLIVIGFSFADKHIKSIVKNALINNTGLNLIIVNPEIESTELQDFVKRAEKYNNVMLFGSKFGNFVDLFRKQFAYSDNLFMDHGDRYE
ncbi:SIR2 family protein [Virgibacillus salexigens]|uniref:SIR2 family protein n=1 Tax=Virgibacillus massiliensis TaxID=1462526 RepID=UPI00136D0003|nr:SIR2 family protein [Virgibacillus massiliensis]MYL41232.1 hypothetical protein [Virgibacillus massiliensis]